MIAFLVFLLVCFIGGSLNPVFVRFTVAEIPPITSTTIRFLGAAIILLPFWYRKREIIPSKDLIKLIPFSLNMALFSIGIQFTSLTMGAILYTLVPLLVAILGYFFVKEKISKHHIVGLIFSLFGAALLIKGSIETSSIFSFGTPLGNAIVLGAVLSWSLYLLGSRALSKKYTSTTILFFAFVSTASLLSILAPFEWQVRPFMLSEVTSKAILSMSGLIVLSSAFNYFLYQWLIKNISAFVASLTQYGGLIFSALSGIIVFQEKLTTNLVLGGFLIVVGVFLATTYQQLKKRYNR